VRRPYRPPYRPGYGYGSAYAGWIGPGYVGYPYGFGDDDFSYDNSGYADANGEYPNDGSYPNDASDAGQPGMYSGDGDGAEAPPIPYQAPWSGANSPSVSAAAASASQASDPVTLVFRDGRPPEQIHNYMLSRTTLSVLDGRHREIPVNELDLPATEKANRAAGVDFRLPDGAR